MNAPSLPHSIAAERNQGPILAQLKNLLMPSGEALEIASGTGQHAAHFAAALAGWTWQPTDYLSTHFAAIEARASRAGVSNVRAPRRLDVLHSPWPSDAPHFGAAQFDLIYCANMLHIAPWECCAGLMQGAAQHLAPLGHLVTYGPYLEDDVPTAPGNLDFDASLRSQNPAWGIRRLEDVAAVAARSGLRLSARHPMPANNLLLVWSHAVTDTVPPATS
jgi:SAM-dependent methyltransferase